MCIFKLRRISCSTLSGSCLAWKSGKICCVSNTVSISYTHNFLSWQLLVSVPELQSSVHAFTISLCYRGTFTCISFLRELLVGDLLAGSSFSCQDFCALALCDNGSRLEILIRSIRCTEGHTQEMRRSMAAEARVLQASLDQVIHCEHGKKGRTRKVTFSLNEMTTTLISSLPRQVTRQQAQTCAHVVDDNGRDASQMNSLTPR